mgnify:CR=1 FL=1
MGVAREDAVHAGLGQPRHLRHLRRGEVAAFEQQRENRVHGAASLAGGFAQIHTNMDHATALARGMDVLKLT